MMNFKEVEIQTNLHRLRQEILLLRNELDSNKKSERPDLNVIPTLTMNFKKDDFEVSIISSGYSVPEAVQGFDYVFGKVDLLKKDKKKKSATDYTGW